MTVIPEVGQPNPGANKSAPVALSQCVAILVTWHPDLTVLQRLMSKLLQQGVDVTVVDNGSSNQSDIAALIAFIQDGIDCLARLVSGHVFHLLFIPAAAGAAPGLVKKAVVGTGGADKTQVQAMLKVLLPGAQIVGADAADALAVAIADAHLVHRF
jgi:hypothetical protein